MKHLLLVILSILTMGCKNNIDNIEQYLKALENSDDSTTEQVNLEKINDYALEKGYPYSLRLFIKNTLLPIDITALSSHKNGDILVIMDFDDGKQITQWNPIDNENIYILFRE